MKKINSPTFDTFGFQQRRKWMLNFLMTFSQYQTSWVRRDPFEKNQACRNTEKWFAFLDWFFYLVFFGFLGFSGQRQLGTKIEMDKGNHPCQVFTGSDWLHWKHHALVVLWKQLLEWRDLSDLKELLGIAEYQNSDTGSKINHFSIKSTWKVNENVHWDFGEGNVACNYLRGWV